MKLQILKFFLLLPLVCSCGSRTSTVESVEVDTIPEPQPLSATPLPSASDITYDIVVHDTVTSGQLSSLRDLYKEAPGWLTFRGGPLRDADFGGKVKGTPSRIVKRWMFETENDQRPTKMGTWGGGTGWTSQPLYIEWPDSTAQRFAQQRGGLVDSLPRQEIMVASLCSKVYFIDFNTGKASRTPLDTHNPVKGTMSLDPQLNGNLYVGQAVPRDVAIGRLAYNLFSHKETMFHNRDSHSWVNWQGNDSSPLVVGGFLFFPSENGTIYKYYIDEDSLRLHTSLRWKTARGGAAGMENSLCVYHNYGFIGNNHGDIMCFELNTMKPIWHYDNHDDIDGTIVCEVVDSIPYLYCGCEVDQQGNKGIAHFVKLNGLTGERVWDNETPCSKLNIGSKHFDGGFYGTPLLGKGNCQELIFDNVCQRENSKVAEFTAFNKKTGEVVYRVPLKSWAWSSPVAFYNENDELFVFTGDTAGNAYLIEGKTGKVLFTERMVNNFESSPVVVGNEFVVGSRGQEIYKFAVE